MAFNFIVYILIPWILGAFLYRGDRRLFLAVFPFYGAVACAVNVIGVFLGWWNFFPFAYGYYSAIMLGLGMYPVIITVFIYLIHTRTINRFGTLIAFAFASTAIKWVLLLAGKTVYGNGWSIYLTFIAFAAAYWVAYEFYVFVRKREMV